MSDFRVISESDDYLVIDKAAGVSVHRDQNELGLISRIANQLGYRQLYLVHRLDKMTSGLLLLAKTQAAAAQLGEKFSARQIDKYYLAISDCRPKKKQGLIIGDMEKGRNGSWKLSQSRENPAITRFISASAEPGIRLFLIRPETGKTHQIRVALKSIGSAITGDQRYHRVAEDWPDRGYLHAWKLVFEWRGERREYCAEPLQGKQFQLQSVAEVLERWSKPWALQWPARKQKV